jgi:hypothetical protein
MTYRERTFQHIAEFTSDVTVRVPLPGAGRLIDDVRATEAFDRSPGKRRP